MTEFHVDNGAAETYPDDLYSYDTILTDGINGLEPVSDADIEQFKTNGFLVIHDAFPQTMIDAALEGLVNLVEGKNPDFTGLQFEATMQDKIESLTPQQRQDAIRKLMWFVNYDNDLNALARNPQLLALVERLIGEPIELFQDMALIKPPRIGREKPWHQDFAYFNLPIGTPVVGVWIALDEALVENGCMHVNPGSHLDGPVVHFQRRDWQICDTDVLLEGIVAIPLKPGSCLLFDGMLHHGTPASHSDQRRRAVQYHYKPVSVPFFDDSTQRLATFGEEGKDVTC